MLFASNQDKSLRMSVRWNKLLSSDIRICISEGAK